MARGENARHFSALFDRSTEEGFYASHPRGRGEQPSGSPNPAYMDSLEAMWKSVVPRLDEEGLCLETTLRELFSTSREYCDREHDHRRVFCGQLVDNRTRVARTYFMLTVPHSHDGFRYVQAPMIQISRTLR